MSVFYGFWVTAGRQRAGNVSKLEGNVLDNMGGLTRGGGGGDGDRDQN